MANKIRYIAILIIAMLLLTSCAEESSTGITKDEYNKMVEVIKLNGEYDLIDVRSALNSFALKALNSKTQEDVDTAISYIEPYSTSLLVSSLKTTSFNSAGEERVLVGIYYCYPEKSSDGRGKFLVVHTIAGTEDLSNYGYIMATISLDGKITQIERW